MTRRNWSLASILTVLSITLARADEPAPNPVATRAQVQQTVDRAIGYLRAETAAWFSTRHCAACHHVPMPLWALNDAERSGYTIDRPFVNEILEESLGSREKMMAAKLIPRPGDPPDTRPLAAGVRTGNVFMAVAANSMPELTAGQKESLQFIFAEVYEKQKEDGSWDFFLARPPINENQASDTAWILMALEGYRGEQSPAHRQALESGRAWLARAAPVASQQDLAFALLLAARAGRPASELHVTSEKLRARQRPDGGWAQLDESPTDAFATGQSLYALALAGETAEQPAIQRGIDWLVAHQRPDGGWTMASRASNDGSPGGSSKLLTPIECGAASWATLGLAKLVPQSR